jgi:hypothetical protein
MAELKTQPTTQKVEDYIKSLPEEYQSDCKKLNTLCKKVTGKKGVMWGGKIAGYGTYHYKYSSGREGDWFPIGFSCRKQNITVYMMCGYKWQQDLLRQLGKHKLSGGSCLYIKRLSDIDEKVLEKMLHAGLKKMKEIQK